MITVVSDYGIIDYRSTGRRGRCGQGGGEPVCGYGDHSGERLSIDLGD